MTRRRAASTILLAALVGIFTAPGAAGQSLRFVTARAFPTGGNPSAIVAEDLDGDDHLDLAVANYDQATITVLRGDGTGDFIPVGDFNARGLPTQMACADFDGDQVFDLLVTEPEADEFYFLRGTGDAMFEQPTLVPSGHDPAAVLPVHVNDDEVLDVVVTFAPETGGGVVIMLGNGDGTFDYDEKRIRALRDGAHGVGAGDFTSDGVLDVVAVTLANELVLLVGDGLGGLSRPTSFATGAQPFRLDVADLDGDERLDVMVADGADSTLSFMRGDGAGAFERAAVIPVGIAPRTVELFDFDGDTVPDAVTANTLSGDASVVRAPGAAGSGRTRHFVAPVQAYAATAGDFDEDGRLDIVVASLADEGASAFVMLQTDDGFEAIESVMPQVEGPRLAAADVDGDGRADLIVGDPAANAVQILPSLGRAGFGEPIASLDDISGGPTALADLDGDGRPDLVVASSSQPGITVALSQASGGFSEPATFEIGGSSNALEVADLDADGRLDVAAVGTNPPQVTVLFGDGAGGLAFGSGQRGGGTLLLARAGRTFEPVAPDIPVSAGFVAAGDLDADGADDLVVTGGVNSMIQILFNDGGGNFTAGQSVRAGGFASGLSLRDLTGDSLPDVIVTLQLAGTFAVAVNAGNRSLSLPVPFLVGARPAGSIGADFDGDGRYDLAVEGNGARVVTNASDLRALRGDGNADGRTSAADAVAFFAELEEGRRQRAESVATGEVASTAGLDGNGDGFIDATDLRPVLYRIFRPG